MTATYCPACDVIDCAGNTLCLECSGPTEPFRRIEPRLSVGVCQPTFTPSLSGRDQVLADRRGARDVFDLLEGITAAAKRIEDAKEPA